MKIFQKCQSCKKRAFIIRKRSYATKTAGVITSQGELCGSCYKNIKQGIKDQLK